MNNDCSDDGECKDYRKCYLWEVLQPTKVGLVREATAAARGRGDRVMYRCALSAGFTVLAAVID
jgi:hypothetical protein